MNSSLFNFSAKYVKLTFFIQFEEDTKNLLKNNLLIRTYM